jgi:transcription elongation factor Elf1
VVLLASDLDLNAPVDVYAEWIDACEAVAKQEADRQLGLGDEPGPANAQDREFSTYGTGGEGRAGMTGDGDDDDY